RTMKVRQQGIVFLQLSALIAILAAASIAQNHESVSATSSPAPKNLAGRAKTPAVRLLSADEGLAVISAALESRANPDSGSDCSHLVHAIYERAGFPYSYASSSSLY